MLDRLLSPAIYKVAELSRVQVPAAVGLVPGELGPFTFAFPRTVEVCGLLVLPHDGDLVVLARLSLSITDENDAPIFTNSRGIAKDLEQPFSMPCLAMAGRAFHPFPIERVVHGRDRWQFTLKNFGAAANVGATSIFYREAPPR